MLHIAWKAGEEFFNCPEDVWASLRDLGEIDTLLHRMGMREEREARIVEGGHAPASFWTSIASRHLG
jgi:hypothetical protein